MRYGALVLWTCWVFQPAQGCRNIRPPHFASKVSYSASPQTFAIYSCTAPGSDAATAMLFGQKSRRIFFDFKHATRQNAVSMGLEPVFPFATIGQERHVHLPRVLHFLNHDGFHAGEFLLRHTKV